MIDRPVRRIRDDSFLFCPDRNWEIIASRCACAYIPRAFLEGRENASERRRVAEFLARPIPSDAGDPGEADVPRFLFGGIRIPGSDGLRPFILDRTLFGPTGLCVAVLPHFSYETVAAILSTGACGHVALPEVLPLGRPLGQPGGTPGFENPEVNADAFGVLDGILFSLTRGIFCGSGGDLLAGQTDGAVFAEKLAILSEFVGCGLTGGSGLQGVAHENSFPGADVGWRNRPEIVSALLLAAMFAAREASGERSLTFGRFSNAGSDASDTSGAPGKKALEFCRRLAGDTGTQFDAAFRDGTLCLYMDPLTYDGQDPEGIKADPWLTGDEEPIAFLILQ